MTDELISYPPNGTPARDCLDVLDTLLNHPTLRKHAFELVSKHCGPSINALQRARSYYRRAAAVRTKFSPSIECAIVAYIIANSLSKSPASRGQLKHFVELFTGQLVSDQWVRSLTHRHSATIKAGKPGAEAKKRHIPALLAETERFISSFDRFQAVVHVADHCLMNVDEKRGSYSSDGGVRLLSRAEFNSNLEHPRGVSLFTLLPFVLANGELFAIFYFFAEPPNQNKETKVVWVPQPCRRRTEPRRFVALTPTSYLSGRHFRDAALRVAELFQQERPGLVCTLLLDSVGIHCDQETISECMAQRLYFHYLIKNATGVCQPLDVKVFGTWTSAFKAGADAVNWAMVQQKHRQRILLAIAYEVEQTAFSRRVIVSGFRDAYIWPWRPGALRSRMLLETASAAPPELDAPTRLAVSAMIEQTRQQQERVEQLGRSVAPVKVRKGDRPKACFELLRAMEQEREAEQQEEAEKREKRQERAEAKRMREEQQLLHKQLMAGRTCAVEGCSAKQYKSTKWRPCPRCNKSVCPKHSSRLDQHQCSAKKTNRRTKRRRRR